MSDGNFIKTHFLIILKMIAPNLFGANEHSMVQSI